MNADFDATILGGGLAGLCLARQLAAEGFSVAVVERGSLPVDAARRKVGESTVEVAAWYLDERLGLRDHLLEEHVVKFGLRFWFSDGAGDQGLGERVEFGPLSGIPGDFSTDLFDEDPKVRRRVGLDPPTYQLHRGRLEHHLAALVATAGVELVDRASVEGIELGEPHLVRVRLAGHEKSIRSRWLVDASGRTGLVREKLGWRRPLRHRVSAAWFWVPGWLDPDAWTEHEGVRTRTLADVRWRSTNHFMRKGAWTWLIPLGDGATSVGLVGSPEHSSAWRDQDAAKAWLREREPRLFEALSEVGSPEDFVHRDVHAHACTGPVDARRIALTGETAAMLDPFYSSGLDLMTIGNEAIVSALRAEREGVALSFAIRPTNAFFSAVVANFEAIVIDSYSMLGRPRAMSTKLGWDMAVYFGWLATLARGGRIGDADFLSALRPAADRLRRLQEAVQPLLRAWARVDDNPVEHRAVDHGQVRLIMDAFRAMRGGPPDADELDARLQRNLASLEKLATCIYRRAGRDLDWALPSGPLNPYGLGLDPARWAADGLQNESRAIEIDDETRRDAARLWGEA